MCRFEALGGGDRETLLAMDVMAMAIVGAFAAL